MKNKTDKKFWTMSIIGGMIVILTVFFVSVKIETNRVNTKIGSTIKYIKEQYSMYSHYNDATEVKSLMRIIENVQQVGRDLEKDKSPIQTRLKQYAKEQKLDGIILLDENDQQIAQYHTGSKFKKVLNYTMKKEAILDVKKYPQKAYVTRIAILEVGKDKEANRSGSGKGTSLFETSKGIISNQAVHVQDKRKKQTV